MTRVDRFVGRLSSSNIGNIKWVVRKKTLALEFGHLDDGLVDEMDNCQAPQHEVTA